MNRLVKRCSGWLLTALIVAQSLPAAGLVVVPPATNDNTTAPANGAAWANVADRGVYLGNRWMIAPFHAGWGPTYFGSSPDPFQVESGSVVRLQNPSGMGATNANADLILYRLTTDPGLPTIYVASTTPSVGAELTFIGDGRSVLPTASESHWNVTGPPNDLFWTPAGTGGNYHGYASTEPPGARKLWGTNLVEDDAVRYPGDLAPGHTVVAEGGPINGDTLSFYSDFDRPGDPGSDATAHEAQALEYDSGSAVFSQESGEWVLSGVIFGVDLFDKQPDGTWTAVYGNLTFAADLSIYRDQIYAVTGIPEAGSFLLLGLAGAVGWASRKFAKRSARVGFRR